MAIQAETLRQIQQMNDSMRSRGRLAVAKFTKGNTGLFQIPRQAIGAQISFDPTVAIVQRDFRKLAAGVDIRSFKEPLKRAIQQVMAPSFQKNFDVGGRPTWAPLSDYARARHEAEGGTGRPLMKSGRLRRVAGQLNIWQIDGQQGRAFVRSLPRRAWYGDIHQEGFTPNITGTSLGGAEEIPARPFLVAQREDLDKVQEVFSKYVQERIDRDLRLRSRGTR